MLVPPGKPRRGETHFAVLPDCAEALAASRHFSRPRARTIRHLSGRPWIIGRWPEENIVVARTEHASIAVIGWCPITADALTRRAEQLRDLAELDALARELPGSFHLIATLDQQQRIQGSASGLRLVFHATVQGLVVAASHAGTLASVIGAEPDERQLATRLLWPVPHPLSEESMWSGVTAVPPDESLFISADGCRARLSRWWWPPEPTRSSAQGAVLVREALAKAVEARLREGDAVSCDLPGGLGATSVCFLTAHSPAEVLACTWSGHDPADTNLPGAESSIEQLPGVERVVWPAKRPPLLYSDLLNFTAASDEPTLSVLDRVRALEHAPELIARGSRLHLTGIGGDHVAARSEAHYHRLARTRPFLAYRGLRSLRTSWDRPSSGVLRALTDTRDYPRWLADSADHLREPLAAGAPSALGWGVVPSLFDWVTPKAARLAREALLLAADTATPLAGDHGTHVDLARIRSCARALRLWDQLADRTGLPIAAPFLDDRVVEAFLSVRPGDRIQEGENSPLLSRAMRGIVPDSCLRGAKKAMAKDNAEEQREHDSGWPALWNRSRLEELDLVDVDKLRVLTQPPAPTGTRDASLHSTTACEVWLRTVDHAARASVPPQATEVSSGEEGA